MVVFSVVLLETSSEDLIQNPNVGGQIRRVSHSAHTIASMFEGLVRNLRFGRSGFMGLDSLLSVGESIQRTCPRPQHGSSVWRVHLFSITDYGDMY